MNRTKTNLAARILVGMGVAVLTGLLNRYLERVSTIDVETLKIISGVGVACLLYVVVVKPLIEYADAQNLGE